MKIKTVAYRLTYRLCLLSSIILFTFISAQAQGDSLSLVISVRDDDNAAVPGVSVTIDQEGCQCGECPPELNSCPSRCCDTRNNKAECCIIGLTRISDDEGSATFNVNAGLYRARVQSSGFKATEVQGIQVAPGKSSRIEIRLTRGADPDTLRVKKSKSQAISTASEIFKTLTIKVKNESDIPGNVTVRVRKLGCDCGACPAGKPCLSGCCECNQGACVCCIDTSDSTDSEGIRSFSVVPGEYEVSFKVAGTLYGTLSGINVDSTAKEVKLPVTISGQVPPK
ncbi:MAG TPA: carboxypeptidase-like regulatory domain-containing protein [Pyrinomonadaceae bacterium]|nr:carboxypeptidase-like regulatory domain-containing protein [Pyrinomonadaceae bacterium]